MRTHLSFSTWSAYMECEARALARDKGEYDFVPTESMLESKYVEELLLDNSEENVEKFKKENPEMFTIKGELRAKFQRAHELADLAREDEIFMTFLQGETQMKLTGVIDGVTVVGFADVVNTNYISDLKVMATFDRAWDPARRTRVSFVELRRYAVQGAIYLELYRQMTGRESNFFIPAMTKEKVPRRTVITFTSTDMETYLEMFKIKLPRIKSIRDGSAAPVRCDDCDYCRLTAITEIVEPQFVGMTGQEKADYRKFIVEGGNRDDY